MWGSKRTTMLNQGELLLLRLLYIFTKFTIVTLADTQHVTEPKEELGRVKEIKVSSSHPSLWFDYPDSDKEKILAVYKLIGEEPAFVAPSTFPQQLRFILVGSIVLILLLFLYQICTKVLGKKGAA